MRSYLIPAVFATTALASADSCTALVLSGGGSNGAWEIGVLWGFVNYGNPDDFKYDVVSGISAGSINTMTMAGWAIGKEVEAFQWASDLWKNLKTSDVWHNWTLSIVEGLTIKGGLLDNSPLLSYMEHVQSTLAQDYQRRVSIGAANVDNGEFHVFDQKNTAYKDLPKASFASASIPGAFPPFNWDGVGIFMDGGTVNNVNIQSAIDQCKEIVDDESKITVDVLICADVAGEVVDEKHVGKTIANVLRDRKIHKAFNGAKTIKRQKKSHPSVNFRYLVNEIVGHAGGLSELSFDGDDTWVLQTQGRSDAQTALNAGVGTHFELLHNYMESDELKSEFTSFGSFMEYLQ